jgi:hypothetical protein
MLHSAYSAINGLGKPLRLRTFRATHASFVQRKLTDSWNGDRRNMQRSLRCPCNLSYVHSQAAVTRRMIAHNSHMNHQHKAAKVVIANAHRMPPLLRADCHCPTLRSSGRTRYGDGRTRRGLGTARHGRGRKQSRRDRLPTRHRPPGCSRGATRAGTAAWRFAPRAVMYA